MTEYRRYFVEGGTYFFTVNLTERSGALLVGHIELLRSAFAATRREHPFNIEAAVILPEHLRAVWILIAMSPRAFTLKIGFIVLTLWADKEPKSDYV